MSKPGIDSETAFSGWLRTGRWPRLEASADIEFKFNPWHDREDGRFTFVGQGNYFPRGGAQDSRGRGRFGGGGATGSWGLPEPRRRPVSSPPPAPRVVTARPIRLGGATRALPTRSSPAKAEEQFRTVVRNGYTYKIDSRGRTRRVSGALTLAETPLRSRTAQRQAGGADRRSRDDGGHYIATRFNGPTEAFNHFAQDLNFNRGRYQALEGQWARAKQAGKIVTVKIVPYYDGGSSRPSMIDVWFTIDGDERSLKFPNERAEKPSGKR